MAEAARLLLLSLLVVLSLGVFAGTLDDASPAELCALMQQDRFGAPKPGKTEEGGWQCATARKSLSAGEPAGASSVRYRAMADGSGHRRLVLELRMRSWRGPQQVLLRFYRYAESLLKRLGIPAPEDLRKAVLSPMEARWQLPAARLSLEKRFSKGITYDLWFIVEAVKPAGNVSRKVPLPGQRSNPD